MRGSEEQLRMMVSTLQQDGSKLRQQLGQLGAVNSHRR